MHTHTLAFFLCELLLLMFFFFRLYNCFFSIELLFENSVPLKYVRNKACNIMRMIPMGNKGRKFQYPIFRILYVIQRYTLMCQNVLSIGIMAFFVCWQFIQNVLDSIIPDPMSVVWLVGFFSLLFLSYVENILLFTLVHLSLLGMNCNVWCLSIPNVCTNMTKM